MRGQRPIIQLGASLLLAVLAGLLLVWGSQAAASAPASGQTLSPREGTPTPTCGPSVAWHIVPTLDGGDENNTLSSVAVVSPTLAWAAGSYDNVASGGIAQTLIERWDGSMWSIVQSPNIGQSHNRLRGVFAISATDAWAVGSYRSLGDNKFHPLTLHWDGTQWSYVVSPSHTNSLGDYLYSASANTSSDVWAVGEWDNGDTNQLLILHWNGSAWNVSPEPNQGEAFNVLKSVAVLAPNDVWAAGIHYSGNPSYTIAPLTIHWNGSYWTTVPTAPLTNMNGRFEGISALSASQIWAVGWQYDGQGGPTLSLAERWDGSQWTMVPSPNPGAGANVLFGVDMLSPADGWAAGYFMGAGGNTKTMTARWNGSQWNLMSSPTNPDNSSTLLAVDAVSAEDAWAVGNYGAGSAAHTLAERYSPVDPCQPTPSATPTHAPVTTATATSQTTGTPTPVPPTPCSIQFADVPPENTFYPYIRCLACRNILGGYSDGTFRPNNNITRGQIAKIVSNAANFQDDVTGRQTYTDVPYTNTFWLWIERLAIRQVMGGYQCGGPGEPCDPQNRAYFRPYNNATRAQLAKIDSNAAGYNENPSGQAFTDVPPAHPFYEWIQRLAARGTMGGYECGGPGEPCDPYNRPYFRPYNNITRGQAAKIVANTFYPNCQTPGRR